MILKPQTIHAKKPRKFVSYVIFMKNINVVCLTYAQSAKWSATIFFWRKQCCSRVPPEKKTMRSRNIYSDFQFINLCMIDSQNHQRRVALNNNIREQKYRTQLKSIPENPESCITVRPSSIKWRKSTTNLPISSWTNSPSPPIYEGNFAYIQENGRNYFPYSCFYTWNPKSKSNAYKISHSMLSQQFSSMIDKLQQYRYNLHRCTT